MLNFERAKTIECRVEVVWSAGLGKSKREDFVVEFSILTQTEIDELDRAILLEIVSKREALNEGEVPSTADPRADAILGHAIGWSGVLDQERNEVPFTTDRLRQLMEDRVIREALIETFRSEILGKEAERKN